MSTKSSLLAEAARFRKAAELYEAMADIFPDKGGPAVYMAAIEGPVFEPTDEKTAFLAEHLGWKDWHFGKWPIIATKSVYGLTVSIQRHEQVPV